MKKFLKAFYLVALRVAKKSHTISANALILPSAIDMCQTVLDKACTAKLKEIPLSDNTMMRRIEHMSDNIKVQLLDLLDTLKQRYFCNMA